MTTWIEHSGLLSRFVFLDKMQKFANFNRVNKGLGFSMKRRCIMV